MSLYKLLLLNGLIQWCVVSSAGRGSMLQSSPYSSSLPPDVKFFQEVATVSTCSAIMQSVIKSVDGGVNEGEPKALSFFIDEPEPSTAAASGPDFKSEESTTPRSSHMFNHLVHYDSCLHNIICGVIITLEKNEYFCCKNKNMCQNA